VMSSLTNAHGTRSSKDNFHLLLSEIDEFGVIKYALIPYFEKYINDFNTGDSNHKTVIDNFVSIRSVYDTFSLILKSNETIDADQHFSKQFHMYRERRRNQLEQEMQNLPEKKNRVIEDKFLEESRIELALNDIKPFLDKFLPVLVQKKKALEAYLINESNIDSEIISLI
jgi:hypothetical protein